MWSEISEAETGKPGKENGVPESSAWQEYVAQGERVEQAADGLKAFLSACKTEREVVRWMEEKLRAEGYKAIADCTELRPGDGVFMNWKGLAFAAFKAGSKPVVEGFNLIGSHADSPRIDFKAKPLYEDSNLLMADTQYYGGLKKYQWVNLPLALHGEIHTVKDGMLTVSIGEDPADPLLLIPDLAPHLDRNLAGRKASETIAGENLDAILGHRPQPDEADAAGEKSKEKHTVKKQILAWMKNNWHISEKDLLAAELSLVPAGPARDAGLDGSLVASYGLDDRVCAWASFQAFLDMTETPERGAFFLATDREEIGSCGLGGAQSSYLELVVLELLDRQNGGGALNLRRAFAASSALSADVTEAANPLYKDAFDSHQMPLAGNGITIMKYSGSGGKYNGGEARGEFLSRLIGLFAEYRVPWQVGSLGKVDKGGGGTIAMYLAELGMDVADCGPAVLSLHSPWEMVSKADVLASYDAYRAFFRAG